ncbi:MAG: AmpG family muropeptide MFS transporter [Bacteroidales bacterium]|nr:AmpG family muropeptide MFS transporter [Bacteroidales bacterium]
MNQKSRSPWAWIPTLYFAQGLPYVAVMTISVIMYKRLGISNTDIALYTSWLYLPWVIKPFWSPFIDMFKTKRWWTVVMQWIIAFSLAGIAFTIPTSLFFQLTLAVFWVMGFTSATHDIAADGFYMHALTEHEQSKYVGIRSTFYRVATVAGQGLLVIIAGAIELSTGLEPVNINVKVSENAAKTISLSEVTNTKASDEMCFNVSSDVLEMTYIADKSDKATIDSLTRLVYESNSANGFVIQEEAKAGVATKKEEGNFTKWVRETFGEERAQVAEAVTNIGIVAVKINQKPVAGEPKVLIVSQKDGDKSIKIDEKTSRLEFNETNWEQPAYMIFTADPKLKESTSATFEGTSGNISFAWMVVFIVLSAFFFIVSIYHGIVLPKPATDGSSAKENLSASDILKEFFITFKTFFTRKPVGQTVAALCFMMLYRFPEAQLVKLINPFLLDSVDKGGLGMTTGEVGFAYGTVGIIGLTIGGIIGGLVAAKGGLKKWLWPMAWSMSLTCGTFLYLSYAQEVSLFIINLCIFIEQFGYGFGFTAYMLYLIYFSEGERKTAHYAICTGFMALGMMLPGMAAGWLQETIGYQHFFIWTMICCLATIGVCAFIKIDPSFGKKKD